MGEYIQKTIAVNNFEMGDVINYLHETYGPASAGVFHLKEKGEIKIESFGKREVVCNCIKPIINELEELIEQNE